MYESYHSRISEDTDDDRRIIILKFYTSGGLSYDSNYEHIGTIEDIAKERMYRLKWLIRNMHQC